MTLATFVRGPDEHAFAGLVAEGGKLGFLWPDGATPPDELPETPTGDDDVARLQAAAEALGGRMDHPFDDFAGAEEAREFVQRYLDDQPEEQRALLVDADDAFGQVTQDYPGFDDALADPNAEIDNAAVDTYVQLLMGPVQPDGPDGWVFRAVDGTPEPEDENAFLRLTPDEDGDEE